MARKVRNAILDTRSARRALKVGPKPHYVRLHDGLHLGYRKGTRKGSAGKWVIRRYLGNERYTVETIGTADDLVEADGLDVLTFDQAQDAARERAKSLAENQRHVAAGPAITVRSAVDDYLVERDVRAKAQSGAPKSDATYRLSKHLLGDKLADRVLSEITAESLSEWRLGLAKVVSAAAADRTASDLRAALNAAFQKHRKRLPASVGAEIKAGLKSTVSKTTTEADGRDMQVLPDPEIRATIIAAAEVDAEGDWEGDLHRMTVVLAASGARFSQVRRLTVADVQVAQGRLMVPVSRKGKGQKAANRIGVRVGADVLDLLKPAIAGRKGHEPLLLRPRWEQVARPGKINSWRKSNERVEWQNASELRNPWDRIRVKAGLSADVIPYAFRHSSIVRGLRAGLPTRLVAALHDTSSAMIERHYSVYIVDALGELAAKAVVPLVSETPISPPSSTSGRQS